MTETMFIDDVTIMTQAELRAARRMGDRERVVSLVSALVVNAGHALGVSGLPADEIGRLLDFYCQQMVEEAARAQASVRA